MGGKKSSDPEVIQKIFNRQKRKYRTKEKRGPLVIEGRRTHAKDKTLIENKKEEERYRV